MNPNFFSKPISKDWSVGHQLLDDYEVMRVLGEGGMGKVYLVRSVSTGTQFAVKRAKGLEDADRKNFLAELQTWIDLPDHPNLVPCRFFRTVEAEILIFADYVEGGSLQDWIESGKLYEGGPNEVLERMLDVAIQLAWGLHCVHELGTVHQDVKPGNVLMASDGLVGVHGLKPQVADFGLARARAAAGEDFNHSSSILVSTIRGTPAYWSPEQSQGLALTHLADIWSWGLSVMEMFTGGVTWMSGLGAADVLDQYGQENEYDDVIPPMPAEVSDLLKKCFSQDPLERPTSLAYAVKKLQRIYQESIGLRYVRTLELIDKTKILNLADKERRSVLGNSWKDPKFWIRKALYAGGCNPDSEDFGMIRKSFTRRGELVAEIGIYDEAKRLYQKLVLDGNIEIESDFGFFCLDKAMLHSAAADIHAAISEYDDAIIIFDRLVNSENRSELANSLAFAYAGKANCVNNLCNKYEAIKIYDKAILIKEKLVNFDEQFDLRNGLALLYMNKALVLHDLGNLIEAIKIYDQAISLQENISDLEQNNDFLNNLALMYSNKSITVSAMGDKRHAIEIYDQSIAIREGLIDAGCHELTNDLAASYMNKAISLSDMGLKRDSIKIFDKAISIREKLVNQDGLYELANDLAMAYLNKANVISDLGDKHEAVTFYDQSIAIRERLVNLEGCRAIANQLAMAYVNKANAVSSIGDRQAAVALYSQAITIRERLVNQENHHELAGVLAQTKAYRGLILTQLGDRIKGLQDMREAKIVLEAEISRTDNHYLKQVLHWLQSNLSKIES